MFQHDLGEGTVLRLFEEHHAAALFALIEANRAYLKEWLPWLDFNTRLDQSLAYIRMSRDQWVANQGFVVGIWHEEALVGTVGFHRVDWNNRSASLGFWLAEDAQGHGLITRSVQACVDEALGAWNLNRIEIRAAVENKRSRAVMERLGFTLEGIARDAEWLYDHFVDHAVYAVLASDWHWPVKRA